MQELALQERFALISLNALDSIHKLLVQKIRTRKGESSVKRLEIHYTPKHGSWLNIAEIELNAMTQNR